MSTSEITNALLREMPGLIRGWPAISRYCQKSIPTLRRYARREKMPVVRWGRHVYLDRHLLAAWLMERERRLRPRS
ncbi:MAG: hypothetical protein DMD31_17565 [Gemmatimonadetes bacterium]|nr:MAG: hypothetical protein DMD31_17565 [Gemmatimonadota bacterium]